MTPDDLESLPPEAELAIAYSPEKVAGRLRTFLALDRRLGRIVSATTEPMLGQMRLAWWRDMLGKPVEERPSGDAVLDAIGELWQGQENALQKVVDAWEILVIADHLGENELRQYAADRGHPFGVFLESADRRDEGRTATSAQRWALADTVARISEESERSAIIAAARDLNDFGGRHPRELRGLAVLDALARRALERGGKPLMDGRGAALVALRAGIIGR
ncbi:hypothetical protein ACI5KX_08720 [Erythrobacter sp. GH1-10]|uniref:hypothetical protein n=1 Tax=Erythrobacter sp. GH1-10 TaxID=3349334 RepID=UPI003877FB02